MNKKVLIGILVAVLALFFWWISSQKQAAAPTDSTAARSGSETAYDQELSGLDAANVSEEFQAIDADLGKL